MDFITKLGSHTNTEPLAVYEPLPAYIQINIS